MSCVTARLFIPATENSEADHLLCGRFHYGENVRSMGAGWRQLF